MKIKRCMLLTRKAIRDALTEKTSLLMIAVPVLFEMIIISLNFSTELEFSKTWILIMCSLFNLALLPLCIFPLLIGEEKEKHTIPVLYRMGVRESEFIASKAVAATVVELVCGILLCLIAGVHNQMTAVHMLCNLSAVIAMLPFGGIVAIYAADKNSVNVYSTAGVFFMMLTPIFSMAGERAAFINKILPSCSVTEVFVPLILGQTPAPGNILKAVGVTVLWFTAGMLIFYIIYKRNGLRVKRLEMK